MFSPTRRGDPGPLRPMLTAEDFKLAFELALERHGLRLQATRNSANQFVSGVYHFRLPDAFRDPVFRPDRTLHLVFDREVFQRVRDEDLGVVRGQRIRPILAGFGEPVTDWLFQSAFEAQPRESAFAVEVRPGWCHGEGWLFVFALRWMGQARRLFAPDGIVGIHCANEREAVTIESADLANLVREGRERHSIPALQPPRPEQAKDLVREVLRARISKHGAPGASPGLSLLLVARVLVPGGVSA